jgi:NADH:ubiquinone oxidoreductase subunit E
VAIFRAVEDRYGYLPERALRIVSDRLSIHWAQVFGAAGLGGFRLLPATGHIITVCNCAACRFAGGPELLAAIEAELGIRAGEETPDGAFSLEVASDVGAGSLSPAVRIDTLVYGPMDPDKARHVVQERRKAAARKPAAAVPS